MRKLLRGSRALRGLRDDLRTFKNEYLGSRISHIRQYLATHELPALHLGANRANLPGWLETDIEPKKDVIYLDASRKFPFADSCLAYIYAEHMIEHISYDSGLTMLRECWRTLKNGGVLRIATPDLAFILNLYRACDGSSAEYIAWIAERFLKSKAHAQPAMVINNAFRAWGHQFLYDEDTLSSALKETGFCDIRRVKYNGSVHEKLQSIEMHGINVDNEAMAQLETMIIEATK
jgi:predicted SAM-dependent methyltransferase